METQKKTQILSLVRYNTLVPSNLQLSLESIVLLLMYRSELSIGFDNEYVGIFLNANSVTQFSTSINVDLDMFSRTRCQLRSISLTLQSSIWFCIMAAMILFCQALAKRCGRIKQLIAKSYSRAAILYLNTASRFWISWYGSLFPRSKSWQIPRYRAHPETYLMPLRSISGYKVRIFDFKQIIPRSAWLP